MDTDNSRYWPTNVKPEHDGRIKGIRERDIERYLMRMAVDLDGLAWKWVSPGNNGVPDRIVILPRRAPVFVEVKAPGKKLTPLQENVHRKLRSLGVDVYVIDSFEKVDEFFSKVLGVERGHR